MEYTVIMLFYSCLFAELNNLVFLLPLYMNVFMNLIILITVSPPPLILLPAFFFFFKDVMSISVHSTPDEADTNLCHDIVIFFILFLIHPNLLFAFLDCNGKTSKGLYLVSHSDDDQVPLLS